MNENEYALPPGYGETGAPGFDQTSHYVDDPFNAQPPYAVQTDYAAPAFDQTSHFVQEPFSAQPPYPVQMEYAAPGFPQLSHAVCPPFNAQPPYSIPVGYGDAPFSAAGAHPLVGLPYATSEGTFTFRSDGSVDAVVNGQAVTYPAGTNKAKKAVKAALKSVGEGSSNDGKFTSDDVFNALDDVVTLFKPSGQDDKSPASNTGNQKEFPWGTVAIVAGGVAVVGTAVWLLWPKKEK